MEFLLVKDPIKVQLRRSLQRKLIINDRICVGLAILGLILAVIAVSLPDVIYDRIVWVVLLELSIPWGGKNPWNDLFLKKFKDWNEETTIVTLLRFLVTLTTIATVYLIVRHYRILI